MLDAVIAALLPHLPGIIDAVAVVIAGQIMAVLTWLMTYLPSVMRARIEEKDMRALDAAITRYVRAGLSEGVDGLEAYLRKHMPETMKRRNPSRTFIETAAAAVKTPGNG